MEQGFFSPKRRSFIASKVGEVGTALVIALVIGEFLSQNSFNYSRFLIGLIVAMVFYMWGTILMPKE